LYDLYLADDPLPWAEASGITRVKESATIMIKNPRMSFLIRHLYRILSYISSRRYGIEMRGIAPNLLNNRCFPLYNDVYAFQIKG
jgi:hypothetical protein